MPLHKNHQGAKHARPSRPTLSKAQQAKASAKISHLHETEAGMPHKQMVAMALNMAREGRLGSRGGYKRAQKRR